MRQRLVRTMGGAALAAALLAGVAACGGDGGDGGTGSGDDKCGLKLAFVGALSGDAANLGLNVAQGADLALQEYNAQNANCGVELLRKDSQGDEKQAPGLARDIVREEKLIGVVGPVFSGETEASAPIFQEAGIPVVTPSATRTSLTTKGWTVFHRAVANDDAQGPAAARYIKNVLNAQKAYVVDDQSAYGTGLVDNVKSVLGPVVVGSDKVQRNVTKDFTPVITKIRSSGATVVFYGGYYQEAGLFVKQMRQQGVTATLFAGDGVNDPGFITTAGKENAEGTILTCPCAPTSAAKGTFVQDYKTKWNQDPALYSDVAYDVTKIYLQGIQAGNTTPAKMNEYLKTVNYQGIANTYKFTDTGELDPSLYIVWTYKVTNGERVPDREAPKN